MAVEAEQFLMLPMPEQVVLVVEVRETLMEQEQLGQLIVAVEEAVVQILVPRVEQVVMVVLV